MRRGSNPTLWPVLLVSLAIVSVSYGDLTNIAPIYGVASADTYWTNSVPAPAERVPGRAIDGDRWTDWNAGSHATPVNPHWLIVDLQNEYDVLDITLVGIERSGGTHFGYTNIYNLYTSTNGTNWTLIASDSWAEHTDPAIHSDTYMLSGDPLRYVKYEVVGGTHWATIHEIEVFAPVVPAPGAILLGTIGAGLVGWMRRRRTL